MKKDESKWEKYNYKRGFVRMHFVINHQDRRYFVYIFYLKMKNTPIPIYVIYGIPMYICTLNQQMNLKSEMVIIKNLSLAK